MRQSTYFLSLFSEVFSTMRSFVIIFSVAIVSCAAQSWTQLPGAAVDISAKGDELWVINVNQQIYRYTGSAWELKPGAAVKVGASPDGWTWVVNSADKIYRFNKINNNWDLMPGELIQISAISKDRGRQDGDTEIMRFNICLFFSRL